MSADLLIYTDERMLNHVTGPGHPERPERLTAAIDGCRRVVSRSVAWRTPSRISRVRLERAHGASYLDLLDSLEGRAGQLDPDTVLSERSLDAARLSAGACADALDAVVGGETKRGIALCRPPGHHAEANRAMGFCLYANAAISALQAIHEHYLQRVLIVDWDVHHGNGTQHILESNPRAAFFSLHEFPLFPGTGAFSERGVGEGAGWTLNVPMTAGQGDAEYAVAFERLLTPFIDQAQPELFIISAGFDAHRLDPLGSMTLSTDCFAWMCEQIVSASERTASGRVLVILEGGYSLEAIADGCEVCARTMLGEPAPAITRRDSDGCRLIERMAESLNSA